MMDGLSRRQGSPAARAIKRFRRHRLAVAGLVVILLLTLLALAAPLLEAWRGVDAEAVNLLARNASPSLAHPLGTDELGRDVLARLLRGGQVSLAVGLAAALVAAVIGTAIGLVSGYLGGRFDAVIMRLTDGVVALPLLPLLIVLAAADPAKLGLAPDLLPPEAQGVLRIVLIIALVGWTTVARLVRAATLSLKTRDFVRAAIAAGAGPGRVMRRHILPNAASPIIVATTLSVGNVILLESALSFLGLGIQPPVPSWGNMLTGALDQVWTAPSLAVWPGLMIFITVLAFNFLGDGLQDALDPRSEDH
ncbi:ABC transporter permease [Telmatospirillum sp. J64-1]|uniref:ABC transporter permease n=1 Tax=Telmatospirillum sp. J64-1 TaxID=2502183 RepID=UPI00163D8C0B|nr:ABC transporter permease [Telmatospirillum sp. J64-1]